MCKKRDQALQILISSPHSPTHKAYQSTRRGFPDNCILLPSAESQVKHSGIAANVDIVSPGFHKVSNLISLMPLKQNPNKLTTNHTPNQNSAPRNRHKPSSEPHLVSTLESTAVLVIKGPSDSALNAPRW